MPDLKKYSAADLVIKTIALASEERKLTANIIAHLEEIERRKIHLERGFSSLFSFCQEVLGYSTDEAMRRISAMRLTREVPEVRVKIEEGVLSLTNLSKVQSFLKAEKKSGKPYSREDKRDLLQKMEGISTRECERQLASLNPAHPQPDRERPLSETQTQITFTADAELLKDLQKIRDLWAHQLSDSSYRELFQKMAKLVLKKIDPEKLPNQANQSVAAPKVTAPTSAKRYIPSTVRTAVWKRDHGRCQYLDSLTNRRCLSTFMLELDHVAPFGKGGPNTIENLRLLCFSHNQLRAAQTYGVSKIAATRDSN